MSSGDTPEVETPEDVKIQAERGVNRYNERIFDGYTDLEAQAIADSEQDRTGLLAGRGAADLAAIERQAYAGVAANPNGLNAFDFARAGEAITGSAADVRNQARQSALNMQDAQRLGVVKTGADIAKSSDSALNTLAGTGISTAFTDAQNEVLKSNAKFSAAMSVAEGAAAGGVKAYRNRLKPIDTSKLRKRINSFEDMY